MIFDWDDFGANHVISNMCQTRDCRDELDKLHYANPQFKATLFAVPGEMTAELMAWCIANKGWIQLAFHGFFHTSNYECEKLTYEEFGEKMEYFADLIDEGVFVKLFKAPGWQISDAAYDWLQQNGWMIADQGYNDHRRPVQLPAYVNYDGEFASVVNGVREDRPAWHGHVWNCCGNGIQETFDQVKALVEKADKFEFVTEVLS